MAEEYILARPAPITIRVEDADRLLSLGNGDAALLYLWILKNGGRCDREQAERELRLSTPVPALLDLLRKEGLIRGEGPRVPAEAPERGLSEPTAEEVRRAAAGDGEFTALLDYASRQLGRVLSGGDMKILYGIYRELGLPADVIRLLMNHCVDDVHRRFGPGRKPTIRQIEKEAYLWAREELFDLDLAERWIRGRTVRSVVDQWQATVKPMHEKYVEPSKKNADIIIPEGGRNKVALSLIVGHIQRHLDRQAQQ